MLEVGRWRLEVRTKREGFSFIGGHNLQPPTSNIQLNYIHLFLWANEMTWALEFTCSLS